MTPLPPEAATGPIAQAPPDRPTLNLEQWAQQGLQMLFADRVLSQDEMQVIRGFFEEVQLRAANGGVGQGGTPPMDGGMGELPQSPMDMNMNTEDMGTAEGAEAYDQGGY